MPYDVTKYDAAELHTRDGAEGVVGYGSFGVVRECYHRKLGQVAVKCLQVSGTAQILSEMEQSLTEAMEGLTRLFHPNTVLLYGVSSWSSNFGIISEFMGGGSLRELLASRRADLPWCLRLRILTDVSNGLAFLHNYDPDRPAVHGNLKPQNILLSDDLRAKVADFGLTALITSCGASSSVHNGSTNQNAVLYTAPELLNDITMEYNRAMDMYSFSMIVYETITRCKVYQKISGNLTLLLSSIVTKGIRPDQGALTTVRGQLQAARSTQDVEIFDLLRKVMVETWDQNPSYRPQIEAVRFELSRMSSTITLCDFTAAASRALQTRGPHKPHHHDVTSMMTLEESFSRVELAPRTPTSPAASEAEWSYAVTPATPKTPATPLTPRESPQHEPSIIFIVTNEVEQCDVYQFTPSTKKFIDLPRLFWEWNNSTAIVLNNTLFVIGANSVFSLNLGAKFGAWESRAPMKTARTHTAAAVVNGKIYVLGGVDIHHKLLSNIEVYDPTINAWNHCGKLKKRRFGHSAIQHNGKIFCVGGANPSIECFDPHDSSTCVVTRTPNRNGFCAVMCDGTIYDIGRKAKLSTDKGGSVKSQTIHFNIDCYVIGSGCWYKADDHKTERSQGCACAVGNKIYLVGGWSKVTSLQYIEAYDTQLNNWKTVATMDHGFVKHVCVT